jgi:tRNA threonylcarbamoyladenosine biosynthesis protein TsaB
MKILSLDSSATVATVALTEDGKLLAEYTLNNGNTHSETLLPMIENILRELRLEASDIDAFALSEGPGSFTGVRIGAATIKGLAFGREKPCIGVSSLEALAYNFIGESGIVASAMDARRSQVYTSIFRVNNGEIERLTEDMAIPVDELCEMLGKYEGERIFLSGDGANLVSTKLGDRAEYDEQRAGQNAYSVALCAYRAYKAGKSTTDSELRPTYLRLAQAERERLEKLAAQNQ